MNDTITINDPELARMFEESGAPSPRDIPRALWLGRTEDGRTREDFEHEDDFEDLALMKSTKFATIADLSAHLAYQGKKARTAYLHILRLTMIRDTMLERANGDSSAKLLDLLNDHLADHGQEPVDTSVTAAAKVTGDTKTATASAP